MDMERWKGFKTWKEEVEDLKEMIPRICPQWTDYNIHDPGITLIELFAWLQQAQMYQIRQIGRDHKREYLQLLGVKPVKLTPASTFVTVKASSSLFLPSGTRFYAGTIPFESKEPQMVTEGDFLSFFTGGNGQDYILEGDWLREGRDVSVFPFGREPKAGAFMEIRLARPLKEGVCHRLYMEFAGEPGRERVSVDENAFDGHGFYPLAEIKMEYSGVNGWRPVGEGGRDGTYGFLQNGSIRFSLDTPMKEGDYRLRFTLARCDYCIPPCITRISLAMVKLWQQETVREEALPVFQGTGFPNQFFDLEEEGLIEEELKVCVDTPGDHRPKVKMLGDPGLDVKMLEKHRQDVKAPEMLGKERASALWETEGKNADVWTKVEDFHCSGPEDRHYRLEKEGILFGDGIHGRSPEGRIRIMRLVRSLGDKGNIKSGTISKLELPEEAGSTPGEDWEQIPEDLVITHEMDVTGGRARESEQEALVRFQTEQKRGWAAPRHRAVTLSDYERLALGTPGLMIEDCKAYVANPQSREVILAVKPCSRQEKPALTNGYERNLYRFLEEKRMIGTKILVVSPDYFEVSVVCTVCAKVQYRMASRTVEEEIRRWILGRGFGQGILYGELLGMIDALPCVQQVCSLWLDGGSRGKRSQRGDLALPANGLLYLKKVTCNLMTPMRERQ